jgi:hypothetical protein
MNTPPSLPPEAPESLVVRREPRAPSPLQMALTELWHDRLYQVCLAGVLLANLGLFVYLVARFANLPDPLPLHFDATGLPDRIESKNGIFALPIIGITVWFLNTGLGILLHRRERAAALLLAIGALGVQILMWFAVINIAGWI